MLISRRRGLKFSPLYTILSSRTMQVVCWGPRDPHIRPGDHPNHPEPTSRASRGEQSPPTTNLSAPDLGETLPERTPPPPSPTTPTRNGNGIEIPSLDARWIDTELSRGLDTLKDDAGWNIPRGRRDTNTALLLPSLPPTPDIFTHIPKRFLIRRALSETSLNAQTVQDRDLYSGLYQSLSQEVSALKGKDTEIQGLRREKEVLANMMRRACRESFLARGNVWTVARIRDPIGTDEGEPRLQYSLDATRTQLRIPLHQDPTRPVEEMATVKPFTFDCVLTPPVSNRVVFEKFETLTQAVLDGFNLCIIADGQSGSGKSYTMMNGPTAIAASAMTSIFAELHNSMSFDYKVSVTCSVLEIYKEHPRDLLGNEKVRISRNLAEPIGCSHHPLHNSDELVALIRKACAQRTDRPTRQNQSSSRGDLVIIITISQHNVAPLEPIVSKLVLVDLAGSESSSSCSSENADEVKIIKKGRECLQRMMIAYEGSKATVPESQLTQLLRRCFEAPSKIILLATASPLQKDQKATQATLDFADRIRNGAAKPSGKRKPQPT